MTDVVELPMDTRQAVTQSKREVYLAVLAATGNKSEALRQSGYTFSAISRTRKTRPEFVEAELQALAQFYESLEGETRRRAMGWDEKRRDGSVVRRYSDTLAMFHLRAYNPELYDDKVRAQKALNESHADLKRLDEDTADVVPEENEENEEW